MSTETEAKFHGWNHYIFDPVTKTVRVTQDAREWTAYDEGKARFLATTEIGHGIKIKTVFLGIDHWPMAEGTCDFDEEGGDNPDGLPVLFGTMIFGGPHDQNEMMYTTYEKAMAGHAFMVAKASVDAKAMDRTSDPDYYRCGL